MYCDKRHENRKFRDNYAHLHGIHVLQLHLELQDGVEIETGERENKKLSICINRKFNL